MLFGASDAVAAHLELSRITFLIRQLRPLPVTLASQAKNGAPQIAQKRRRPYNLARPGRLGEPLAGLGLG